MYNHNSITCSVTGCLRAVTWPPPQTLWAQVSRVKTSRASTTKLSRRRSRWRIFPRTASTTWSNCRLRRRLETRRAFSTTRLSRNHRTLSKEWLDPGDRDRVLIVTDSQAKVCVGLVNHPEWAIIQWREGRTSSVTADEHVLRLPESRWYMHRSRGRCQRRRSEGIHEALEVV